MTQLLTSVMTRAALSFAVAMLGVMAGALIAGSAARAEIVAKDPAALAAYGQKISQSCFTCHVDRRDIGVPSIQGWPREEMVLRLKGYKDGYLKHDVMNRISALLDDFDIWAIASYISSLKATEVATKPAARPRPGMSALVNEFRSVEAALKSQMPDDRKELYCATFSCAAEPLLKPATDPNKK